MGNFCQYCGKQLQEGEICNCMQQTSEQAQQAQNEVKFEYIQKNPEKKKVVPKRFVPIGQTAIGGILVLLALMCGGYDWGYISFVGGAGFLLTGICALIDI